MTLIFADQTFIRSRGHFDTAWWLICKTYSCGKYNGSFLKGGSAETITWWIENHTKIRIHPKLFRKVCEEAKQRGMCVYEKTQGTMYGGCRMLIPKYLRYNLLVCRVSLPEGASEAELDFIERTLEEHLPTPKPKPKPRLSFADLSKNLVLWDTKVFYKPESTGVEFELGGSYSCYPDKDEIEKRAGAKKFALELKAAFASKLPYFPAANEEHTPYILRLVPTHESYEAARTIMVPHENHPFGKTGFKGELIFRAVATNGQTSETCFPDIFITEYELEVSHEINRDGRAATLGLTLKFEKPNEKENNEQVYGTANNN